MKRPAPATIIATVALFFALTGTGVAASQLAKNSVGTPQLKKNAVTGDKVKDGSLLAKDFKDGQLPAGPQGPQGAKGETGAQGARGPAGADAASQILGVRMTSPVTLKADGVTAEFVRVERPLVLTEWSRVTVQATIGMQKPDYDAAKKARIVCVAVVDDPSDPLEMIQLSVPIYQQFLVNDDGLALDGGITTTGSRVLPAGTYEPYVTCVNQSIAPYTADVWVYGATLDVSAAPETPTG